MATGEHDPLGVPEGIAQIKIAGLDEKISAFLQRRLAVLLALKATTAYADSDRMVERALLAKAFVHDPDSLSHMRPTSIVILKNRHFIL